MELKEKIFNEKNNNFAEETKLKNPVTMKKNSLLALSMIWFAYFLIITIAFASLIVWQQKAIVSFIEKHINEFAFLIITITLFIAFFVLSIIISFFSHKMSKGWLISVLTFFALFWGILLIPIINHFLSQPIAKSLALLLIPSVTMLLVGILAYFNVINFSKVWPIIIAISIALGIVILITFLTNDSFVQRKLNLLIAVLGFIIIVLYMGIDFMLISKRGRFIEEYDVQVEKDFLMKQGILFGFHLATDFIVLIRYTLVILNSLKN
ncbi:MAG0110 family membrane protein [Mycoplasmopsis hyopharyngis]|uniref:MAG0110 family membrane protein n=1 Tax=Mycoplasmopsis hyopharyngis TaxID=29558 RepID=UPI003872F350